MDIDATIREKMLERISELGVTQASLAKTLDVTPQAVGQIIRGGKSKIPPSLLRMLDALGLELVVQPKNKK